MNPISHLVVLALAFFALSAYPEPRLRAPAWQDATQSPPPQPPQNVPAQPAPASPAKSSSPKAAAKPPSETEELQQAINTAGNDRAALVRNLEAFLQKYPESSQRLQIYRALAEASLQLRDNLRATNYAERIVAMSPEDMSMTLLAIQLLERNGDDAGLRRAISYCTRVSGYIELTAAEKSPKISQQDWQAEQRRSRTNILVMRGRLYFKLHDYANAEHDFESSMALSPTAPAAEKLGEIAELSKHWDAAIKAYAQAFVLTDAGKGAEDRKEIRQKLGNVWRLAHGSDQGLGDFLLHSYDDSIASAAPAKSKRNADAKDPYDFQLRNARDGSPFPLADQKGKVVVLNFWATWCGPCRALEPHFERVAAQFQGSSDIVFLNADCDEDESLVPAYLEEVKPRAMVVFADGLDRLLAVHAFPTVVVLDRAGKIAYRAEGFDPDEVEAELSGALRRVLSAGTDPAHEPAQGARSAL